MPIHHIYLKNGPNGLNWQRCLVGSSKSAPRILIFFNCHECQTFFLAEIHCYLSALKSWHNNLFLSGVYDKKTFWLLCWWLSMNFSIFTRSLGTIIFYSFFSIHITLLAIGITAIEIFKLHKTKYTMLQIRLCVA